MGESRREPIAVDPAMDLLRALSPEIAAAIDAIESEWSPEDVPITIAMGEIGRAVAERFDVWVRSARVVELARTIDVLLDLGTDEVKNAVATGLLESLAHRLDRAANAEALFRELGPLAKEYLRAYDAFTGVTTPGVDSTVR